jgi:hypothetical protein
VVEDASDPAAAHLAMRTVGEDGGIFEREILLVIEAIGHPALDLPTTQSSLVHLPMEGVPIVVALGLRA